ncbi:MAG: hypothetical protein KC713_10380, partial [Candidatus Omnitrophica bacterium]|nr:hypothetical protein [Candidatus Omnitrophota bacterium]
MSLIYKHYAHNSSNLYFYDLLGAACGCFIGCVFLNHLKFSSIPIVMGLIAFSTSLIIKIGFKSKLPTKILSVLMISILTPLLYFNQQYGILDHIDKDSGVTNELWSDWNAYSRIGLLEFQDPSSDGKYYKFSLDHGSGYALLKQFNPDVPFQDRLFENFEASALGFLMGRPKKILILFAGAGRDMVEAHSYSQGHADITGIELNPLIIQKAVSLPYFGLNEFFQLPNIHMISAEGRNFIETNNHRYDSIIYSWAGSTINNYFGINSNTSQFLYTQEAFAKLLHRLTPGGTIGIVNGRKLRVLATFKKAFEEFGVFDISPHVVMFVNNTIRDNLFFNSLLSLGNETRILVKKTPFTEKDIQTIQKNLSAMNMHILYAPHISHKNVTKEQKNIEQILMKIMRGAHTEEFMRHVSYQTHLDLSPLSDDKPFIDNSFNVEALFNVEFWNKLKNQYKSIYLNHYFRHFYSIIFILCIIMLGVLLLLYVIFSQRDRIKISRDAPYILLFSTIGLAFIFVEISVLNQFT